MVTVVLDSRKLPDASHEARMRATAIPLGEVQGLGCLVVAGGLVGFCYGFMRFFRTYKGFPERRFSIELRVVIKEMLRYLLLFFFCCNQDLGLRAWGA